MNAKSIRRSRVRLGLTQRQVADRVGVDPVTISRWERGVSAPHSPAIIRALESFLSINGSDEAQNRPRRKASESP